MEEKGAYVPLFIDEKVRTVRAYLVCVRAQGTLCVRQVGVSREVGARRSSGADCFLGNALLRRVPCSCTVLMCLYFYWCCISYGI